MPVLDNARLAELAGRLRYRRRQMLDEIAAQLSANEDAAGLALINHAQDTDDWAVADQLVETDIAMLNRDVEELRDIDAALRRMDAMRYGVCTDCDDAIPFARLMAYPTARRCKPCQMQYEKRHGQRPGATL